MFPVSLDDVWPLAYDRKSNVVRTMKNQFIEGIDYQQLLKKSSKIVGSGGHNKIDYRITVGCLEFLVARKDFAVFDVYRQVFHRVITPAPLPIPTATELAWMVIKNEENIKALQSENSEKDEEIARLTPKARL